MKKYLSKVKLLFMWAIFWRGIILAFALGAVFGAIAATIIVFTGGDWDEFTKSTTFTLSSKFMAWLAGYLILWHMLLKHKDMIMDELEKDEKATIAKTEEKLRKLKEKE